MHKYIIGLFLFISLKAYTQMFAGIVAETDTSLGNAMQMNEVVVTGTRTEHYLKDVPVLTQVLRPVKMLRLGITDVATALQHHAQGIDFNQQGTLTTINMQGLDGKYVLFLIDGERIAGELTGNIDYNRLSLSDVERIEIIRGASSAIYGSNAIGGVINIIPKKNKAPLEILAYSRSSFITGPDSILNNTRAASISRFYSKNINEVASGLSIGLSNGIISSTTGLNCNGIYGYNLKPSNIYSRTQEELQNYSVLQRFTLQASKKLNLTSNGNFYNKEIFDVDVKPIHSAYQGLSGSLKSEYLVTDKVKMNLSYMADNYSTSDKLELLNNKTRKTSAHLLQSIRFITVANTNYQTISAGFEGNYENLESERIQAGKKSANEKSAFVQDEIKITQQLSTVLGFRTATHSVYGANAVPKISIMYKLNNLSIRTGYGKGFRSPSLKEIYMNFDHFGQWEIIGNTNLKPEKSDYYNLSFEYSNLISNSTLNFYYNNLTNMISDRWVMAKTRMYDNISKGNVKGFDINTRFKISVNWAIAGGYSFVNSYNNLTQKQLYGTVRNSGHGSVDYEGVLLNNRFFANLYCKIHGKKFYEITTNELTGTEILDQDEPYMVWKLSITQQVKQYFNISVGIDNIFNEIHPNSRDFISPGRKYFLALNYSFR